MHHLAALEQLAEGGREVLLDRAHQHLGVHRIDYDEDELPLHG